MHLKPQCWYNSKHLGESRRYQVSFLSNLNLSFSKKKYRARFYLEPRSLFIFKDLHYSEHFHGIEEDIEDEIIDETELRFLE